MNEIKSKNPQKEIYFLDDEIITDKHAGFKARADAREIFLRCGYKRLDAVRKMKQNILEKLISYIKILFRLGKIPKDSIVVLQFPLMNLYRIQKILGKNFKIAALVHDLDFLRGGEKSKKNYEILLKSCAVISHNPKMTKILEQMGVSKEKIINLGVFDYLLNGNPPLPKLKENTVVFAGNLTKSGFVEKLKNLNLKNIKIRLYGIADNPDSLISKNIEYAGAFEADEIPFRLKGGYSLVWDGGELETCGGAVGNYQRYNNPHKVSLSIISRFPLIVWEEAAMADFVLSEGIGFTVKNLFELDEKINAITDEEYGKFQENLARLSKKLLSGFYLESALKKAEEKIGGGYKYSVVFAVRLALEILEKQNQKEISCRSKSFKEGAAA